MSQGFLTTSFLVISYAGIYDGHGGSMCSEYVKNVLHQNILAELEAEANYDGRWRVNLNCNYWTHWNLELTDEIIVRSILNGFSKTEEDYIALSKEQKEFSGSCVSSVLITDDKIYVANLGDCRTLLIRKTEKFNLKALSLSRDHKANLEKARIKRIGGYLKNGRVNGVLAISRTIGDREFKEPIQTSTPSSPVNNTKSPTRRIDYPVQIRLKNLGKSLSDLSLNERSNNFQPPERLQKAASSLKIGKKEKRTQPIEVQEEESLPDECVIVNCFDAETAKKNKKLIGKKSPPVDPVSEFDTIVSAVPEITIMPRHESDVFIVVGSDGLYDFMQNKKIANNIKKSYLMLDKTNETLNDICKLLCEESYFKGSDDDITCVLMQLVELPK